MADRKIKVLCIPSDRSGCGFYRSLRPHTKLQEMYGDEFDVDIKYDFNWRDLKEVAKYDIIHLHKGLFQDMQGFRNALSFCKMAKITVIIDVDDYWNVGPHHPQYLSNKKSGMGQMIADNLKLADYVTTTTPLFADKIRPLNSNVRVWVNAIDPEEEQFIPKDEPHDKIRIGFIMGSSHQRDMEQFEGVINRLGPDIMNKVQMVLCGYDLRGTMRIIQADGTTKTRPIQPLESVWYTYEKCVTDDYKICSPEYKDFLLKFLDHADYPNVQNEHYRRVWTKDISCYAEHYNTLDILLAPLDTNDFNACKSELKLIEGGFFSKAVVCTNFGPYTIGTKSLLGPNGTINEDGNCILVDPSKKHKAWAQAIKKLVENPEYIDLLGKNLHNDICTKYDLNNVTRDRAAWYKEIAHLDRPQMFSNEEPKPAVEPTIEEKKDEQTS